MTNWLHRCLFACATLLASCATSTSMPAPPPPAFLKDRPSETRNGLLVNFTQAKAGAAAAPDPLRGLDGKRIRTTSDWIGRRRDEVLKLLLDNQYGRPPTSDGGLSERTFLASDDGLALGGLAHREQIALMAGESRIDVVLYLPAQAKGPVPVVLNVLFSPTIVMVDDPGVREVDGWDASHNRINGRAARPIAKPDIAPYLARGYGVALVYYGQIEPDFDGGAAFGLRSKDYPAGPRGEREWGSIGVWSQGLSRVLDYLATDPKVDGKRVALYGVSRLGKTVLWAGAQDQRFAAVISVCSGEGGAALSRRDYGETIGQVAKAFPYWFAPRWNSFAKDPTAAPIDADLVLSLLAPRPLLLITSSEDAWSDPYGEFLAALAASPVWELFGKKGLSAGVYPSLDTLAGGDIAFMTHAGPHGPAPIDTKVILDFLDAHLQEERSDARH